MANENVDSDWSVLIVQFVVSRILLAKQWAWPPPIVSTVVVHGPVYCARPFAASSQCCPGLELYRPALASIIGRCIHVIHTPLIILNKVEFFSFFLSFLYQSL